MIDTEMNESQTRTHITHSAPIMANEVNILMREKWCMAVAQGRSARR